MKTSNIGGHAYIEDLIDEGMEETLLSILTLQRKELR